MGPALAMPLVAAVLRERASGSGLHLLNNLGASCAILAFHRLEAHDRWLSWRWVSHGQAPRRMKTLSSPLHGTERHGLDKMRL